ncbi:6-carboxytetrahydropterin synthase QueD [Paenibacillus thalictri]|uniref:6-carboxy-5,6,7,8-tetrahydropterin synthase n=1 Tax=Paenibacillus thalictri TaxID=2527873 RepID=A0A4Q9DWF1_9BACL|nr:6-carboxytetrahydropterin synthase QueD [Paenibacillus thalictri]TBL80329.1 6-carboxytetrahydropterin synthase QueD [Paenibacillus thalictri]
MLYQYYPQVVHHYVYELNKDFHMSAAHFIPSELAGKCQHTHGHTYTVNVTIAGDELDEIGFLIDFKMIKQAVHDRYDHTLLNDHAEYRSQFPTTEVVAKEICNTIQSLLDSKPNRPQCLQVIVRETPTSYVVYRPKRDL